MFSYDSKYNVHTAKNNIKKSFRIDYISGYIKILKKPSSSLKIYSTLEPQIN